MLPLVPSASKSCTICTCTTVSLHWMLCMPYIICHITLLNEVLFFIERNICYASYVQPNRQTSCPCNAHRAADSALILCATAQLLAFKHSFENRGINITFLAGSLLIAFSGINEFIHRDKEKTPSD